MTRVLLIVNGPAYGSDETYNALRLAIALSDREDVDATVFLMGDAVTCAVSEQRTPDGYYRLDRMLQTVVRKGGTVACCGTCLDARGLTPERLIEEAERSTMAELAGLTVGADRVLTF
jgi:uncharacterized protein involved in oxidation of intracellular sulfur